MTTLVYTLEDPRTHAIKYVGITSGPLHQRMIAHIKEARYKTSSSLSGKHRWLRELEELDLIPIISELESSTYDREYVEDFIEPYWIWQLKSWGFDLFNIKVLVTNYSKMPKHTVFKTPITQYTLEGDFIYRFPSISTAGMAIDANCSTLQRAARLKNGYKAYGFQWRYDKDVSSYIGAAKSSTLPNVYKPVLQFKDGVLIKEWRSGQDAAYTLGFLKSKISNCCNGKRKTHGGYTWEFKK